MEGVQESPAPFSSDENELKEKESPAPFSDDEKKLREKETPAPFSDDDDDQLGESVIVHELDTDGYDSEAFAATLEDNSYKFGNNESGTEEIFTESPNEPQSTDIEEDMDEPVRNGPFRNTERCSTVSGNVGQKIKRKLEDVPLLTDDEDDFENISPNKGHASTSKAVPIRKRKMKAADKIAECAERSADLAQKFIEQKLKLDREEIEVKKRLAKPAEDGKCSIS